VCERTKTTYKNKRQLLEKIDSLPAAGPQFKCHNVKITGDIKDANNQLKVEELELFYHDPVECVHELISNPA
jgi:hypothetical protein